MDLLMKRKRNKPRAYRALKSRQYDKLFEIHCPRMIRYVPSKELGEGGALRDARFVPSSGGQVVCHSLQAAAWLPLRIGVDAPKKDGPCKVLGTTSAFATSISVTPCTSTCRACTILGHGTRRFVLAGALGVCM